MWLDLRLVGAVDGQPDDVEAEHGAPHGVSGSRVGVKIEERDSTCLRGM